MTGANNFISRSTDLGSAQAKLSGLLPDTLFQQKIPATIYFPFYAQIFPHCLKTGSEACVVHPKAFIFTFPKVEPHAFIYSI